MTALIWASKSSAVMKGMSTEELTRASKVVLTGYAEDVRAQWSKDGKTIFTSATITNIHVIKGEIAQKRITVEYEGGEVGDIGHKVSDAALIRKGEKVILFLKDGKSRKDGTVFNIVGKAQGKYTIDNDGIASKGGFSITGGEENIDNNIPADVLVNKIKRIK